LIKKCNIVGKIVLLFFYVYLHIIISFFSFQQEKSAYDIVLNMFSTSKNIHTLSYTMHKTERINGELILQKSTVKFQKTPMKVYNKQLFPKSGIEVLYDETTPKKAIVNTNGFPWVNLNLDPEGTIMRNKQHHTIKKTGYDYFISVLEHLFNKYGKEVHTMLKMETVTFDNRPCWEVTLSNPNFKFMDYIVKKDEDLLSIANREKINEYLILEKNPSVKFYNAIKANQKITITNDYSPKMVLLIDKKLNIPVTIKVFEGNTLFEQYEYYDLKINPKFSPEEFSTTYKDYRF
jgi:outer membrane lipoprotein-sorting protein